MRDFVCPKCGQHLAFENSTCLSCGSAVGFSLDEMAMLVIAHEEDPYFTAPSREWGEGVRQVFRHLPELRW